MNQFFYDIAIPICARKHILFEIQCSQNGILCFHWPATGLNRRLGLGDFEELTNDDMMMKSSFNCHKRIRVYYSTNWGH